MVMNVKSINESNAMIRKGTTMFSILSPFLLVFSDIPEKILP
jgi:hypothetical protein